ncbi:MAG: hypothetical protein JXA37_08465 [Chloroflexia bacterium]|nr:hypothetical protein [Chloroflexia bacterium]
MTQEIIYRAPDGIVLASDSLIIREQHGHRERLTARKLFPLTPWLALLTAGAYVGIEISRHFAAMLRPQRGQFLEQATPLLQDFFQQEYAHFIQSNQAWFAAHPEAYRSLYVLLVGRSKKEQLSPWQAVFLSSEAHELPFTQNAVAEILTIPRRLGLEGQLMMRMKTATPLEDVAAFCQSALHALAERDPDQVGRPIHVAILSAAGFRWWTPPKQEQP